jgi:acyl-CoA synthetase (AMP-forming)/AMP-acid ligase II
VTAPTIADLLRERAGRAPDAPALLDEHGAVLTYAALARQVDEVAAWLRGIVGPRQVVATVGGNGPQGIALIAAAASVAVCAPLPPGRTLDERRDELTRLRAAVLVLPAAGPGTADDERAAAALGIPVVDVGAAPRRVSAPECSVPGTALLMPTSGTTGAPKLVPLSASALLTAARGVAATLGLTTADRCLSVVPQHYTHGVVGVALSSLSAGASVICLPRYSDDGFAHALHTLHPTWYTAVPAVHARVLALAAAGRVDGHELRMARSASAPLRVSLRQELRAALGVPVVQAYALTEAPGQVCAQAPGDPVADDTVGPAVGCTVAVRDASGREITGQVGEIHVRGPHVAPGYLATADAELIPNPGGWLRTADLGHLDASGELHLAGRRDDVINRAGVKLQPDEIEEVLARYPGVRDVCVFGVPDPVMGETAAGLLVGSVDPDEVLAHARSALSREKVPARLVLTDRIPRFGNGKVNRRELARLLPAEPTPADVERGVADIWTAVLLLPSIGPDDEFADLGGGSLQGARVEAMVAERFGVELPPAAILREAPTIRAMAALVRDLVPPADR